jgi:hypothetical protein
MTLTTFTVECEHCDRGLLVTQEEWDDVCGRGLAMLCSDCLADNE